MNKMRTSYLFVAILSFLAVIALVFFAATASKDNVAFVAGAVFFALTSTFWAYRFVQEKRAV